MFMLHPVGDMMPVLDFRGGMMLALSIVHLPVAVPVGLLRKIHHVTCAVTFPLDWCVQEHARTHTHTHTYTHQATVLGWLGVREWSVLIG